MRMSSWKLCWTGSRTPSPKRWFTYLFRLAGRLKMIKGENPPSYSVFLDCNDSPGAKFIYATLDVSVYDILSQTCVPPFVQSFFDHYKAVNHDGHTMSLLSVQVNELVNGVFIGRYMNHCLGDGTSSTLEGHGPIINLPHTNPDEFISRFEASEFKETIFHFSVGSIAKLKAKANAECNCCNEISSLQSLSALVWSIAGELLERDLGWAAWKVHQAVTDYDDKAIHEFLNSWLRSPYVFQFGQLFDRFNKYGSEFGMGNALALRSGYANKFDGQISCYPGREGGGSIDLEMCLSPDTMRALESNVKFMEAAGLTIT
ncbi:hypothetical protein TIFTF001_007051 [Ficus carica]|uniref:Uncharacterized protein n=1 Tax=Ficus carica TaxID=3494 RepID=A0AA88CZA1_FICCA|nr:hypothetical protein TIFTF001_007051 [Ficus carica]